MVEGKINEIHGWAAKAPGIKVEPWSYIPRPLGENDVEIKIEYSGICGSDLHTIKGEWGPALLPAIVGHEIIGKVITKGEKVADLSEGDIVGVGAQVFACLKDDCKACSRGLDPHCPHMVFTYDSKYADGHQAHGGYAEAVRVDSSYVFKIPDAIEPIYAPPLMCAGTTVFAPMLRKGVKKGDRVGVVGIGGLGHLAIQYASALGAEVVAFSHSPSKREQALELGASIFVDTSNKEEVDAVRRSLNFLFITSNSKGNQYQEFITWMDFEGQIVLLAVPEGQLSFAPSDFITTEVSISGSLIGGVDVIKKTLEFSAKHNIRPMIERYPIAKINEALERVDTGKARYRVVLETEKSNL
ncbi:putative mannitol dehydrogenase [Martensiomyces pterosporus]|nr:putative mannitol dehydrogenase [Martensiomyces pterosporus]